MADVTLTITQPVHGSALNGPVELKGTAAGNTTGLFFKWFSSLNGAGTETQPEINKLDHSLAAVSSAGPALGEFGSHTVVLAATDRDGIDLPQVKLITRSALAGGAPPKAPNPCLVHQVAGSQILLPSNATPNLSKANAQVEFLAPSAWLKPNPDDPGGAWIVNTDYRDLHDVAMALRLLPGNPGIEPAVWESLPLDKTMLYAFRDGDKRPRLRWTGTLPNGLANGSYTLQLVTSAGAQSATVPQVVTLVN